MKKIYTTILTLAVLGGGYVGAKALEHKATVRLADEEGWYPVDDMENRLTESPIPGFSEETNCGEGTQNCAAYFEKNSNNELEINPSTLVDGEFQE